MWNREESLKGLISKSLDFGFSVSIRKSIYTKDVLYSFQCKEGRTIELSLMCKEQDFKNADALIQKEIES